MFKPVFNRHYISLTHCQNVWENPGMLFVVDHWFSIKYVDYSAESWPLATPRRFTDTSGHDTYFIRVSRDPFGLKVKGQFHGGP